jgi:biopolymer transport protein ExbD
MSASMSSETKAEPNLTPLLDVVFQLITFFMLVINFSNENYDVRVRLPVAGSARPLEEGEKSAADDRLVLNITRQGHLLMSGEDLTPIKAMEAIKHQAMLVKLNMKSAGIKLNATGDLPTLIVLRADRETEFSSLYSLIQACQANGFRKFALKAMNAE